MGKEKDVIDIWKERIKDEARHGDKTTACKEVGTTLTTLRTAMARKKFLDLKNGELKTLHRLMEILDDRKEQFEKIQTQYAS